MRITSRRKTIAFFHHARRLPGSLAHFSNVSWIVYHWRSVVPLVLNRFFSASPSPACCHTIFIVAKSAATTARTPPINAVTHELKTPITSIRLYLGNASISPARRAHAAILRNAMLDARRGLSTVVSKSTVEEASRHLSHKTQLARNRAWVRRAGEIEAFRR